MNPYLKLQVETSTPVERVVLLYDRLLVLLKEAFSAIEEGDVKKKVNALSKAERIITLLNSSLDMEKGKDVAKALRDFYETIQWGIFIVNRDNDLKALKNLIYMVKEVKGAWEEIALKER
ncbi:flagellar export chaperone FliS [Thermovibrio sp.]